MLSRATSNSNLSWFLKLFPKLQKKIKRALHRTNCNCIIARSPPRHVWVKGHRGEVKDDSSLLC